MLPHSNLPPPLPYQTQSLTLEPLEQAHLKILLSFCYNIFIVFCFFYAENSLPFSSLLFSSLLFSSLLFSSLLFTSLLFSSLLFSFLSFLFFSFLFFSPLLLFFVGYSPPRAMTKEDSNQNLMTENGTNYLN